MRTGKRLLFIIFFLAAMYAHSADVLPSDRIINWVAGIPGGVPVNTNVFASVKDAPYSATGDGTTDDYAAITNAIGQCTVGQVLYFPAGVYKITIGIVVRKGITLRGAGTTATRILSTSDDTVFTLGGVSDNGVSVPVTSVCSKGTNQIIVSDASSISSGDFICLSQTNKWGLVTNTGYSTPATWVGVSNGTRAMIQIVVVTNKVSNTLTLSRPVYYTMDNDPRVFRQGLVTNIGIEDMSIEQGPNAGDGYNINFTAAAYSWAKNIYSTNTQNAHIFLRNSYGCEVRHCYCDDAQDHASGKGYGIYIFGPNSDHLIEDNIVRRARHSLIFEGGGSGCIFGYNYAVNVFSDPDNTFLPGDMDTHGAHPYMNLFEGNVFAKLAHDNTWGSSSHNTTFRCYVTLTSAGMTTALWAIDIQKNNYYENVVGCVIGNSGDMGLYMPSSIPSSSTLAIYRLGFETPSATDSTDTNVAYTTIRHMNFDFVTGTNTLSPGLETSLPNSYYLQGKPTWFGILGWPAIGPDVSASTNAATYLIPAQYRYLYGVDPPQRMIKSTTVKVQNWHIGGAP